MRVRTLEIRWHNGDPIYACDFQPLPQAQLKKIIAPRIVSTAAAKEKEKDASTSTSSTSANPTAAFGVGQSFRFATGGSDNQVRVRAIRSFQSGLSPPLALATPVHNAHPSLLQIWMVYPNVVPPSMAASASTSQAKATPPPPRVEYLATLSKHAGAVNVVRFSPNGKLRRGPRRARRY